MAFDRYGVIKPELPIINIYYYLLSMLKCILIYRKIHRTLQTGNLCNRINCDKTDDDKEGPYVSLPAQARALQLHGGQKFVTMC